MRTPDEYFSSLPTAADPPAVQKVSGLASTSVGPSSPPHRPSESGHPLEKELEDTIEKEERLAEEYKEEVSRVTKLGWNKKTSVHREDYVQRRRARWQALARRANAVWDLDQKRNPISDNRSSSRPSRLHFAPQCEANDGTIHCLRLPSCKSRHSNLYSRKRKDYLPGAWAAREGQRHANTSWRSAKAPWERELEEAEKMKTSTKQLVKPSASSTDSAESPSRNASSCPPGPAPVSSPKRRRDDDDNDNGGEVQSQRPASPKRVRLSPPPPKSPSLLVSAASTSSRPSSPPAVGSPSPVRSVSLPPPSPRPWVISSQKRRREDDDNNDNDEGVSRPPKRIRLSTMPLPKRAGSAPPALATGPVLVASPVVASPVLAAGHSSLSTSSSTSQVPAAAPDSPSRQPSPVRPSSSSSPSPSSSGSSPSSPPAAAADSIPAVKPKSVPQKTAASYRTPRRRSSHGRRA